MTKLLISYSRKDKVFAQKLVNRLLERQVDVWIDWEDIPPSTDWWTEIKRGIEEADVFIFLASPDSIISRICADEVLHAASNGKRLIPLIVRDVSPKDVLPELSKLNWIFFRDTDSFEESCHKLDIAIHTDFEWVQIHREIQVKALKWERHAFENSFLVRGRELLDAEKYFSTKQGVDPKPTTLQQNFILKSRQYAVRQRKLLMSISSGVLIVFIGLLSFVPIRNAMYKMQAQKSGETVLIHGGPAEFGDNLLAENGIALPEQTRTLDAFRIEIYEVTYERYSLCVSAGECTHPNGVFDEKKDTKKPVTQINVTQAMEFCLWIDRRLPNELEWERAARYDVGRDWPWKRPEPPSDDQVANLNYERINPATIDPNDVGRALKGVSEEGVYDLIGNVWEWTCTPTQSEPDSCWMEPSNPSMPDAFVVRGGGANIPPGPSVVSAYRDSASWDYDLSRFIGFRCVAAP